MKKQEKKKKKYSKPKITSEEIFGSVVLACGKCDSGPWYQQTCSSYPQNS